MRKRSKQLQRKVHEARKKMSEKVVESKKVYDRNDAPKEWDTT
jgi:predicted DNA-binding protein (UPF0251 family)